MFFFFDIRKIWCESHSITTQIARQVFFFFPIFLVPVGFWIRGIKAQRSVECLHPLVGFPRESDVVDFEDHSDELGGERDLLLLRQQSLDHVLSLHVVRSPLQAIDAQSRVVFFHLRDCRIDTPFYGAVFVADADDFEDADADAVDDDDDDDDDDDVADSNTDDGVR